MLVMMGGTKQIACLAFCLIDQGRISVTLCLRVVRWKPHGFVSSGTSIFWMLRICNCSAKLAVFKYTLYLIQFWIVLHFSHVKGSNINNIPFALSVSYGWSCTTMHSEKGCISVLSWYFLATLIAVKKCSIAPGTHSRLCAHIVEVGGFA